MHIQGYEPSEANAAFCAKRETRGGALSSPEPPVPLVGETWARRPGGSGDIRFEDFWTSGHFRFKSKKEDSLLSNGPAKKQAEKQ